jgi:hypothetical protein
MFPKIKNRFTLFAGVIVVLMSVLVICGWIFNIPILTSFREGYAAMKFNTAVCFLSSGLSVLFLLSNNKILRTTGKILALFTAVIGVLTLTEQLAGINLGLEAFYSNFVRSGASPNVGRMSAASASNILFTGLGL